MGHRTRNNVRSVRFVPGWPSEMVRSTCATFGPLRNAAFTTVLCGHASTRVSGGYGETTPVGTRRRSSRSVRPSETMALFTARGTSGTVGGRLAPVSCWGCPGSGYVSRRSLLVCSPCAPCRRAVADDRYAARPRRRRHRNRGSQANITSIAIGVLAVYPERREPRAPCSRCVDPSGARPSPGRSRRGTRCER
jgi:hypothetical protein